MHVDATPGTNDMPSKLSFLTTADGASSATTRMTIKNDGKIGMGITTPDNNLTVASTASNGGINIYRNATDTESGNLNIYRSRGSFYSPTANASGDEISNLNSYAHDGSVFRRVAGIMVEVDGTVGSGDTPGRIAFQTAPDGTSSPVNRMMIKNDGKVGIGTDAPIAPLSVVSPETTNHRAASVHAPSLANGQYVEMVMGKAESNRDRATWTYWHVGDDSANNRQSFAFYGGVGDILSIRADGRVGIGTTAPGYKLDVTGDVNASGCVRASGSLLGGTCTSDERLKTDIVSFDLGLDALMGLEPKYFKYNGLAEQPVSAQPELGVIAQDVERTAPELVVKKMVKLHADDVEETEIKQVNYTGFIYVLINSVKELYAKMLGVQNEVKENKMQTQSELEHLKAQVELLNAQNKQLQLQNKQLQLQNKQQEERLKRIERSLASERK